MQEFHTGGEDVDFLASNFHICRLQDFSNSLSICEANGSMASTTLCQDLRRLRLDEITYQYLEAGKVLL